MRILMRILIVRHGWGPEFNELKLVLLRVFFCKKKVLTKEFSGSKVKDHGGEA